MSSLANLIDKRIRSLVAAPALVKVSRAYVKPTTGGYCLDGCVLVPETLRQTSELVKEVPISPIWADNDGRGIYAPPSAGQIVVVDFVGHNKAWPVVLGVYSDGYKPAASAKTGQLVICDGKGARIALSADGLLTLANNAGSLKALLDTILDLVDGLQMTGTGNMGAPVFSAVMPSVPAQVQAIKAQVAKLFKE